MLQPTTKSGCTPYPRLVELQLADFRKVVTTEARHLGGLELERQEAIWRYGMRLKIDAFDWRGHEEALEKFAEALAEVIAEGIDIRTVRAQNPGDH